MSSMRGCTRLLTGVLLVALVGMGPAGAVGLGSTGAGGMGASMAQTQPTCDFQSLYGETIGSVVTVQVQTPDGGGLGSGFLYDEQGRIVTNQHVVADATQVEVQFNRGQWRTARVVGTDAYSDLALLDVRNVPDYADPLSVNASNPDPGQPVAAFGSPLGLEGTITNGIVSGTNRSLPAGGPQGPQFSIPNTLQTTAAINPGNSGGPLVDCRGNVVGVNTATAAGGENTGFAIPASRVERVVPELAENGSYSHSYLGITSTEVTPSVADANGLRRARGVIVADVLPGTPAEGVLQGSDSTAEANGVAIPVGGDVILRMAGQRVRSQEDLASVLVQKRPGETVRLTILRDGERRQVEVELGTRPEPGE